MLQTVRLGMFEMCCEELIRALVKRAEIICGKLIAKMFRDHQEVNTRYLCDTDFFFFRGMLDKINCHSNKVMD